MSDRYLLFADHAAKPQSMSVWWIGTLRMLALVFSLSSGVNAK